MWCVLCLLCVQRIASSERQATKPFIVAWWLSLFSLFVLAASHCYLGPCGARAPTPRQPGSL